MEYYGGGKEKQSKTTFIHNRPKQLLTVAWNQRGKGGFKKTKKRKRNTNGKMKENRKKHKKKGTRTRTGEKEGKDGKEVTYSVNDREKNKK